MDDLVFRKAKNSDVPSIIKIYSNVKEIEDYAGMKYDKNYFDLFLHSKYAELYVVCQNKKILGATNIELAPKAFLFLNNIVVSKDARGKGVGRLMLKNLELIAKKIKAKRIVFFVYKWNKPMRKIVEHYNYTHSGELFLYSKKA